MKVAIIQLSVIIGDRAGNQRAVREMFNRAVAAHQPDVVLLPELWDIGFFPHPIADYVDEDGASAREFLSGLARERHVNLVGGSVAARLDGKVRNICYIYDREGNRVAEYSKTHLFTPAHEHHAFAAGDRLTTFTLDGVRCGVLICYDLRFPEAARTVALRGAQVMFFPAAWPTARIDSWGILNQARAAENQVCVAACNGTGACAHGVELGGESMLVNSRGTILARTDRSASIIAADLDIAEIARVRADITTYPDRRPELYDVSSTGN